MCRLLGVWAKISTKALLATTCKTSTSLALTSPTRFVHRAFFARLCSWLTLSMMRLM